MTTHEKAVFLSGVGGSGMSAIACYLADSGTRTSGSDRKFDKEPDNPIRRILSARGIEIVPQDGTHPLKDDTLMVMSAAVESDRPEVLTARTLGVPLISRGEYLAQLSARLRTLAVAGTSGKSTTSGMTAFVMEQLGLDPVFIGGGRVRQFGGKDTPGNYRAGNSGILVTEACESDGHLSKYRPEHSLILNLALDHLGLAETENLFSSLIHNTAGKVILNADDPGLMALAPGDCLTFSIEQGSDFHAGNIQLDPMGSRFSIKGVEFTLQQPGAHNVYNAAATLAALSLYGARLKDCVQPISAWEGVERRFQVYQTAEGGPVVIDDYAHNPHKISFLMRTMREISPRVCYVFQPHGFGPARMMRKEYAETFASLLRAGDALHILPIFYAGGTASKDISSQDLAQDIREQADVLASAPPDRSSLLAGLGEGFGAYVVFGARDESLGHLAHEIANRVKI